MERERVSNAATWLRTFSSRAAIVSPVVDPGCTVCRVDRKRELLSGSREISACRDVVLVVVWQTDPSSTVKLPYNGLQKNLKSNKIRYRESSLFKSRVKRNLHRRAKNRNLNALNKERSVRGSVIRKFGCIEIWTTGNGQSPWSDGRRKITALSCSENLLFLVIVIGTARIKCCGND